MELYEPNSAPFIVEFWQNFIVYLVQLLRSNNIEDTVCSNPVCVWRVVPGGKFEL